MSGNTKGSRFNNLKNNTVKFYREIRSELKRVIWPNRQQVINNTVTVLAACLVIGVILWTVDFGLGRLAQKVFMR